MFAKNALACVQPSRRLLCRSGDFFCRSEADPFERGCNGQGRNGWYETCDVT